jgi:hypothetical protein
VPLLLLGPHALLQPTTVQIRIRAPVWTLDHEHVGEVHRVVIDLDERAAAGVVVLGRGALVRDVLVPVDLIASVKHGALALRLSAAELDRLPDFVVNEFVTPPPTWTSFAPRIDGPTLVPSIRRKRVGPGKQDITPSTRVRAQDGDIGMVERIEVDPLGHLEAFWVHADGIFATDMRIPAKWVQRDDAGNTLPVAGNRAEIEAYLGYESRARLGR